MEKFDYNPELTPDDIRTLNAGLQSHDLETKMAALNHPKFSILDWEVMNGKWRQRKRYFYVEDQIPQISNGAIKSAFSNLLQKTKQI